MCRVVKGVVLCVVYDVMFLRRCCVILSQQRMRLLRGGLPLTLVANMKAFDADVLCLQEVRCGVDEFLHKPGMQQFIADMAYAHVAYHVSAENIGQAGVMVFSRIPFLSLGEGVGDAPLDIEGRVAWVEFENFFLYNIYAPNSGQPNNLKSMPKKLSFMQQLTNAANTAHKSAKHHLYCGDFNVTRLETDVWNGLSDTRWQQFPSCTLPERSACQRFLDTGLVDLQRHLKVDEYTFYRSRQMEDANLGMRLDYFFCSPGFLPWVKGSHTGRSCHGSDHRPIHVYLAAELSPRATETHTPTIGEQRTSAAVVFEQPPPAFRQELAAAAAGSQPPPAFQQELAAAAAGSQPPPAFRRRNSAAAAGSERRRTHPLDRLKDGRINLADMQAYLNGVEPQTTFTEPTEERWNSLASFDSTPIVPLVRCDIENTRCKAAALVDTGASLCVASNKYLEDILGEETVAAMLQDGFLPTFTKADGSKSKPAGKITLNFVLEQIPFVWDFYVLPEAIYPLILGTDFLKAAKASILCGTNKMEFRSTLTGEIVQVPFDAKREPNYVVRRLAALLSQEELVLPPYTEASLDVRTDRLTQPCLRAKVFGGVFQAPDLTGPAVKPGNDTLDGGCTTIIVMNPYPDRYIRISKGQHVASFEEKRPSQVRTRVGCYPLRPHQDGCR